MPRIFVPSSGPGDWRALLAEPEKHWARRYSARTLAHCWEDTDGFPIEVGRVLAQHPSLATAEPLLIFPEWKVNLPGGSRSSQNDIWVLAKSQSGLISIAVEGKVAEPLDRTVGEWKVDASRGKETRLTYLTGMLGLRNAIPNHVRYQLVHRAASAVIEVERFGARHAVMLVHSFSAENRWFEDFVAFAALFELEVEIGQLVTTTAAKGLPLHLAWVHGDERYSNA